MQVGQGTGKPSQHTDPEALGMLFRFFLLEKMFKKIF